MLRTREDVRIGELAAWVYAPEGATMCVVLMHGLTATRELRLDAFGEALADAGFAALVFDFRHLGASGGEPRQLVDLKRQYEDCDAALAYARERFERVVVWGTSFAGGHSIDAAVRHDWLAGAIALVPFADGLAPPPRPDPRQLVWMIGAALRDASRARRGREPYLVDVVGPRGSRAFIANDPAWASLDRTVPADTVWRNRVTPRVALQVQRHRPVKRAADVGCPLLVQVADGDTAVPIKPAIKAAERAPRGELIRYPGADHFDPYVEPLFDTVVADQLGVSRAAVITFLSDYGLADEFVGVVHGVIARIAPDVRVIDLGHGVPRQNVLAGALALERALPYVPAGVHLAVVDPEVGAQRRAVALRTANEDRLLVGPDNGLLTLAAERFGGAVEAVEVSHSPWRLEPVSATFHGRDVFAPVAARLAAGAELAEAGEPFDPDDLVALARTRSRVEDDGTVVATVVGRDGFGNLTLDLEHSELADTALRLGRPVRVGDRAGTFARTFADVAEGELLLYEDAGRRLAVAVSSGDAAAALGLDLGDEVRLEAG